MKVEFNIENCDVLHIRYMYCKECRNYQFDVPCAMKIKACKSKGETFIGAVLKALEGIAWVPGTLKNTEIENADEGKPGISVSIYNMEDENEEV